MAVAHTSDRNGSFDEAFQAVSGRGPQARLFVLVRLITALAAGHVTNTLTSVAGEPAFQPSTQSAGAVVLVNSQSAKYLDFQQFIQPYLDTFGFPYTVLDLKRPDGKGGLALAPLTVEAMSPNVPVAHKELTPATMKVTYEFAAVGSQPALKLVWYQGDIKPPGWTPAWGGRSCLFIGDKGMLLGNGKLLPEERFKDFPKPPETLPRSPGHWVEWVNYAKGQGPVPGSNFQYSGWTTEANHLGNVAYRTGRKIEWDYVNLRATNAPEAAPFIKRPAYRKGWDDILKT